MEEKVINKRVRDFSKTTDIIQTIAIFLVAFLVPTFLGQAIKAIFGTASPITSNSQIIVGSIVNTALVMAAINLKGWWKILGVVTMPSVSTILSGAIFPAPASKYMVFMIPAIWVGNFALVYAFKYIMLAKKQNYFLAGIVGIVVKVAVIFGFFMLLNKGFGVFPDKIATNLTKAMGMIQLITASIGCIVSSAIYYSEKKSIKD